MLFSFKKQAKTISNLSDDDQKTLVYWQTSRYQFSNIARQSGASLPTKLTYNSVREKKMSSDIFPNPFSLAPLPPPFLNFAHSKGTLWIKINQSQISDKKFKEKISP